MILTRINPTAYEVQLPLESRIHPVFHVSQLRKALLPCTTATPSLPTVTDIIAALSSCSDIAGAALPLVAASKFRYNGLHPPTRTSPGKTGSTSSSVSRPLRLGDKPKRKKEGMSGAHLTASTSTRTWASQRRESGPSESSSPTGATSARTGSSEASATAVTKGEGDR
jgi:hypothetical protein